MVLEGGNERPLLNAMDNRSLSKTRNRMMTSIAFSRQKDAGSSSRKISSSQACRKISIFQPNEGRREASEGPVTRATGKGAGKIMHLCFCRLQNLVRVVVIQKQSNNEVRHNADPVSVETLPKMAIHIHIFHTYSFS